MDPGGKEMDAAAGVAARAECRMSMTTMWAVGADV
jgi:hypothetical protein